MAKKTVRPFTFLTSILLSLTAASVNAWVWPGDIVTSAEEGRYPGLAVRAMGEGILAVHSGTLLSVSEDLVVLDHGNGIWGLYFYSGTSETVWALRRGMDSSFLTADTIVPSELLTDRVFYLSFWDTRTERWIDPRQLLPPIDYPMQKLSILGFQEGRLTDISNLRSGPVELLVSVSVPRLNMPFEIALLVNGSVTDRVRFADIVPGDLREYYGAFYIPLGSTVLRNGENTIETIVFTYFNERLVRGTVIDTSSRD